LGWFLGERGWGLNIVGAFPSLKGIFFRMEGITPRSGKYQLGSWVPLRNFSKIDGYVLLTVLGYG
jgi:hypothetical protein